MRVPTRKNDKIPREKIEPKITIEKYKQLQSNLNKLKKEVLPIQIEEVKELSTGGDYSENAGYQESKYRLRRTNSKILSIENLLSRAEIIESNKYSKKIDIGSTIELEINGSIRNFQILGSLESNPSKGFISYSSPLGSALLGRSSGEKFSLNINNKNIVYKIKKINF